MIDIIYYTNNIFSCLIAAPLCRTPLKHSALDSSQLCLPWTDSCRPLDNVRGSLEAETMVKPRHPMAKAEKEDHKYVFSWEPRRVTLFPGLSTPRFISSPSYRRNQGPFIWVRITPSTQCSRSDTHQAHIYLHFPRKKPSHLPQIKFLHLLYCPPPGVFWVGWITYVLLCQIHHLRSCWSMEWSKIPCTSLSQRYTPEYAELWPP